MVIETSTHNTVQPDRKESKQTILFMKIILIATTKLKASAAAGPHVRC